MSAQKTDHKKSRGWALIAATLATATVFLNGSVVNVALPSIDRELNAGFSGLQWVLDGYLLTLASLLILGGVLGDRYGQRRIMLIGLIGTAATLLLCGFAPTISWLVIGRILQGIAGALLVPTSLALIRKLYTDQEERGSAIGKWSGYSGIATVIGPLLGGWLVTELSWRWSFYVGIPIVLVTGFILLTRVAETKKEHTGESFDWLGAALVTFGLAGIAFGLIEGPVIGWNAPLVLAGLVGGAVAIILFPFVESRSTNPMVPLQLFESRNFTGANLTTLAVYAALQGTTFLLVLYIQNVMGYSPLLSGLMLAPVSFIMLVFSPLVGRWAGRYGPRYFMSVGPIILALGLALLTILEPDYPIWTGLLPIISVFGLGLSLTVAPLTNTVVTAVSEHHSGVAAAFNNMVSRVAGLLAIAGLGVVVTLTFNNSLQNSLNTTSLQPDMNQRLTAMMDNPTGSIDTDRLTDPAEQVYDTSFTNAFGWAMGISAALAAAAGIVSFFTIRNPSQVQDGN